MDNRTQLQAMVDAFSVARLQTFLRAAAGNFRPMTEDYNHFIDNDGAVGGFDALTKVGEIVYDDSRRLLAIAAHTHNELTSRSGRRRQYDLAKRMLKTQFYDAGIFVFYDDGGRFRFSLVVAQYLGARREFTNYRRYTYFVAPDLPNKTFVNQIGRADFSTIERVLAAFSIEAVSEEFYAAFKPHFDDTASAVAGAKVAQNIKEDFTLLFVIRTIFLGFVQKKGWLGGNPRFLQEYWAEYQRQFAGKDRFYNEWPKPLFFEALNSPPGHKVAYGKAPFSPETERILQMAPYLNGELFKEKRGVDDLDLWIPDAKIEAFFAWLFQYNFTIEENTLYDEELELNPEFLGIIFERLVNKADGAVYTPRTEVDFMCRMALVKWLEPQLQSACLLVAKDDLFNLFFRNMGQGAEFDEAQKQGDFSTAELRKLIELLESVTMCDPAAGSGAFEVGMLHVLNEVLENLYHRSNLPAEVRDNVPTAFERKKRIIANSLYGVEVKRWAVWINHLRLWLSLFVDMPDDYRDSFQPLLPNLTFKVREGDSLVQRLGSRTFPVQGHARLSPAVKAKVTRLKQRKRDFFYNQGEDYRAIESEELRVFEAILDEEIEEKDQKLRGLLEPKEKQGAFNLGDVKPTQVSLAVTDEKTRRQLEDEIAELKARKQSLREERPFIWSIEFAEIFFEKGGFDLIIGNPPYVRQEEIADPNGLLGVNNYKAALKEMVLLDFPEYFARAADRLHEFKKDREPSGRSDLYIYFYIRSLRLLNERGLHVFICSNSWLDVGYGAWLQEFLLRGAVPHYVFDNHARRSFANADINTVITVIGAPGFAKAARKGANHYARFVAFKRPFEEVILAEHLVALEMQQSIELNDAYRIYPITVTDLLAEGSETEGEGIRATAKYVGDKWGGKYLRAPDIFFTILKKGHGRLIKLGKIANVRFSIKTGSNEFFYLESLGPGVTPGTLRVRNSAGWQGEIEQEFLHPVIKSPRECRAIQITRQELKFHVFLCNRGRPELRGTNALDYIKWGENATIEVRAGAAKGTIVRGYNNLSSVSNRKNWWDIGKHPIPSFAMVKGPWNRHFVVINTAGAYCDQQLYAIESNSAEDTLDLGLRTNSTLTALFFELEGRRNLGEGILWLATYEVKNVRVLCVPLQVQIDNSFLSRPVRDIFGECGIDPKSDIPIAEQEPAPLPDRKALDDIVFDALGLDQEERKQVYRAVCQLVWERISRAKSVTRN